MVGVGYLAQGYWRTEDRTGNRQIGRRASLLSLKTWKRFPNVLCSSLTPGKFLLTSDCGPSSVRFDERPFRNLPYLHTLLLDHNLLTSQALREEALSGLPRLQVLALGHNHIGQARPLALEENPKVYAVECPAGSYPACLIRADGLKGTSALRSLKLEGNQITRLDAGWLPLDDLKDLESLDLSGNLISQGVKDSRSFWDSVHLRCLDLSRNRLSSAVSQSLSDLSRPADLNLHLNLWICSCQLLDLAAFLSAFMQQPDKTLNNGPRMVCVSAANPAVRAVLELTDANCVRSNHNITVHVEAADSVTPKTYARDLAITAVICFIGGVALTLVVVLVYYQVSRRKKVAKSPNLRETDEGSSTLANHLIHHCDVADKHSRLFLQAHQLLDSQTLPRDGRSGKPGGQFRVLDDENDISFTCADCKANGWHDRMRGVTQVEEEAERKRLRMMIMEEDRRRKLENQKDISGGGVPHKFLSRASAVSSSGQWKDIFSRVAYPAYPDEVKRRQPEVLHCESCNRTYGQSAQTMRQSRIHSHVRHSALFDGFPSQSNQFHSMKNMNSTRQTRNVTFDLESSRRWKKERDSWRKAMKQDQERRVERKHKGKSGRMLKANLKPRRKNKVHPKRNSESKKGKDGRKESEETEGKESSSERLKERRKKGSKASKTEGQIEADDPKAEAASRRAQDASEGGKGETRQDLTDPSHPTITEVASVTGRGPNIPDDGVGLVLGSPHLSSQPPPLPLSNSIHACSFPLQGSAASLLTDSNLSTQGGTLLLNTAAPASTSLVPTGPTSSTDPNMLVNRAVLALGGSADILRRQDSLISAGNSLLLNSTHASLLPSSVFQTPPLHSSQPGGPGPNVAGNSSHTQLLSQSQLDLVCASLDAGWKSDPTPVQGPQAGEGPSHLASGSEQQSLVLPIEAPEIAASSVALTPQNALDNLFKSNVQTEDAGAPSSAAVSASAGGRLGIEGQVLQPGDIPGSPGSSPHSTSSSGGTAAASPLLQQEFLSEEGGSSPRRKLRLVLPEKTSTRAPTALEKKIR
ncbi:uncharacterized protein lrrc53 isoform X2 [Dunckerocampus dactyliophorus]|nr:uncharacterized protein lrrc53 isoform X2 [Dunckerocampus dactyliophorus]